MPNESFQRHCALKFGVGFQVIPERREGGDLSRLEQIVEWLKQARVQTPEHLHEVKAAFEFGGDEQDTFPSQKVFRDFGSEARGVQVGQQRTESDEGVIQLFFAREIWRKRSM